MNTNQLIEIKDDTGKALSDVKIFPNLVEAYIVRKRLTNISLIIVVDKSR